MLYEQTKYSCMIVSSSAKVKDALSPMLAQNGCYSVLHVGNVASAKRAALETEFDFVIVDAPLPDDFGAKFAMDVCGGKSTVCLLLTGTERYEELRGKLTPAGVFTLPKPISGASINRAFSFMTAARERLRNMERKTLTIEEKMEQIRLVNRAKWLLIENLKMTEPDAHHYIEKQAMDTCMSKSEIAKKIIKTYA